MVCRCSVGTHTAGHDASLHKRTPGNSLLELERTSVNALNSMIRKTVHVIKRKMPEMAYLIPPQLTLLSTRRNSPLCAFGTSIILIYICGIGIYLWSANYACRLRNLGETPPSILTSMKWDIEQRGHYIILKNYIRGALQVNKHKSITFATAANFQDLSHLPEVCSRWQGPMSISIYAPGSDFKKALRKILHLRLVNSCIHQNVTWHMYFDVEYNPSTSYNFKSPEEEAELESPSYSYETWIKGTFKSHGKLPFPANVGRNVAIQESQTNYILMTDLMYYPSANITPRFLKLLEFEVSAKNRVYVLPVFKLEWYGKSPETKSELVQMIAEGNIVLPSGTSDCTQCNIFPNARKWLEVRSSDEILSVYYISRDKDEFESWQPYYISTKKIPLFDEDQIKEGKYDRKLQLFQLCLQHYEFHILDNAFLVQVRQQEETMKDITILQKFVQQNTIAREKKIEELFCRYGSDTGCSI